MYVDTVVFLHEQPHWENSIVSLIAIIVSNIIYITPIHMYAHTQVLWILA